MTVALRLSVAILIAAAASAAGAATLQAQTRADSAAVLLRAAEQLRDRGDAAAARAVLMLITERYGGTPAAGEVDTMLAAMRRAPRAEESGRTELLVWGATYGGWLGVTVPFMAGADSPEAYGLGLLLGAPAGFLAARRYSAAVRPTKGQARAITFGGSWGTYQGFGWAEYLELGRETVCRGSPDPEVPCYINDDENEARARIGAAVLGGLAGMGAGALLARRPISEGTAAAVSLGGMWGSWLGFAGGYVAGVDGDGDLLLVTLLGGNAALIGTALRAPHWDMSESRARLISVGGLIGGLGGAGLVLILQPDDDRVAMAIPLATSIAGLAVAAHQTRTDEPRSPDQGALLNRDARGWAAGVPAATLRLERARDRLEPMLHVPLLRVRFD